ncbi:MAG: bifunctional phosphopantothenoylcysteine decarboxylase/phosphopantothenate--cysteine ligase CoaBC [Acidimicrobiales bacterium]
MSTAGPPGRLGGRFVVLGVCGGIAAYKAVEVCRRMVDAGAHVAPVLTPGSLRFVGEVTFSALASELAQTSLFGGAEPIPHTRLGRAADVVVVAPATARLIGTYAAGIADDLLSATLLATRAPVVLCPAMHTEMWEHPAVQDNIELLRNRGVSLVEPGSGRLAGGDEGVGRLAEPAEIVAAVEAAVTPPDLLGLTVLVTAGGTREPIDPVRFLGNRSSGKQGHALAAEARARGARVVLITSSWRTLATPPGAEVVAVETAAEMGEAALRVAVGADVVVMAAAVADFRPKLAAATKIRKVDGIPELILEQTADISAELGRRRRPGQTLVGFAAETDAVVPRAAEKLRGKGLDLIVANDVSADEAGFEHDTNRATILDSEGGCREVELASKRSVAAAVLDAVVAWRRAHPAGSAGPTPGPDRPNRQD